jgi:hypothetical protein
MNRAMIMLVSDPRVDEVENEGMDEGRWFVHLVDGYCTAETRQHTDNMREHSFSVGGAVEGLKRLKTVVACDCAQCIKSTDRGGE